MLNIETDYNADKAGCLLSILNYGTVSCFLYCERSEYNNCPFEDIQKAKKQICEFINECNIHRNVERYGEHDVNISLDYNKSTKEKEDHE